MSTTTLSLALEELNIDLHQVLAFGYLAAATTIETTSTSEYYSIGPFTNPYSLGFIVSGNKITYTGTNPKLIKVLFSVCASSDTSTTYATIAIRKNDSIVTGSNKAVQLKLTADTRAWVTFADEELKNGDTIELVINTDKAGAKITFCNAQANLFQATLTHE
jgi:hypothetical protein